EVMTDKATVELPSPRAGTIAKINFKDGDICPVGKVLVVIDEEGGAAAAPPDNGHGKPERSKPTTHVGTPPPPRPATTTGSIQAVEGTVSRERVLATPAPRRLARQLGVEIGRVPATGKHGRVTAEDVKRFQGNGGSAPAIVKQPAHAPIAIAKGGDEERIPL